jgi:hypothetical protein
VRVNGLDLRVQHAPRHAQYSRAGQLYRCRTPTGRTALYGLVSFCLPRWRARVVSYYHQPAIPPVVYKLGAATRSRRMAASSSSSFLASSASPSSRAAARTCGERRAPR